jgi:hypothetical protein
MRRIKTIRMICAVMSNSPLSDSAHAIIAQQSHGSRKCRLTGGSSARTKQSRQFWLAALEPP